MVAEFRFFQLLLKRQRWRHFGKNVAYCTYHIFQTSPVTPIFFLFLLCVYPEFHPGKFEEILISGTITDELP